MSDPANRSVEKQAYLLLVLTTFFWSLNYPFVRAYRDDAPPVAMAFWRWSIALAILLPFVWRALRSEWPKIRRNWRPLLVLGAFSCSLNSVLAYVGIQNTTVTNASLLNAMTPILTLLLAVPLARERLSPARAVGVLVSFSGVVWIVIGGDVRTVTDLSLNYGDFAIIAACAVWGVYTNLLRRWSLQLTAITSLATMIAAGVLVMLPLYAGEVAFGRPAHWSVGLGLSFIALALFPSLIANFSWNRAVMTIGPSRAAAVSYLLPVFSIAIAIGLLGESLHTYHWIGAALIFLGIALATRGR